MRVAASKRSVALAGCLVLSYVILRSLGWPECGPAAQCLALAERYQQGQVVQRDLGKARRLFEKACSRGAAVGCTRAGWMYERESGGRPDLGKAASYFDRACHGHDADGCLFQARAYASGLGVPKSEERARSLTGQAVSLHEQACQSSDRRACLRLFEILARGDGLTRDLSRAIGFAERACSLGEKAACLPAGRWYLTGEGGRRDASRAADLLERACEGKGSALGCCALATVYAAGSGVVANPSQARSLFRKACSLGEGQACIASYSGASEISKRVSDALVAFSESCANRYPAEGCADRVCERNDPKNREMRAGALRTLQRACDDNESHACLVLGLVYDQSLGASGDSAKAAGLLEKACAGGVPTGCYALAHLLSFGKEDLMRAKALYRKACETGLSVACDAEG